MNWAGVEPVTWVVQVASEYAVMVKVPTASRWLPAEKGLPFTTPPTANVAFLNCPVTSEATHLFMMTALTADGALLHDASL